MPVRSRKSLSDCARGIEATPRISRTSRDLCLRMKLAKSLRIQAQFEPKEEASRAADAEDARYSSKQVFLCRKPHWILIRPQSRTSLPSLQVSAGLSGREVSSSEARENSPALRGEWPGPGRRRQKSIHGAWKAAGGLAPG